MRAEETILNALAELEEGQVLPGVGELKEKVLLDHLAQTRVELEEEIVHVERARCALLDQFVVISNICCRRSSHIRLVVVNHESLIEII